MVASVLSGNRNFEGRIHPEMRANYLMSPPLVVAYALAGRIDIDLDKEPLGADKAGKPVFLKDIWPSPAEVAPPSSKRGQAEHVRKRLRHRLRGRRPLAQHPHRRKARPTRGTTPRRTSSTRPTSTA